MLEEIALKGYELESSGLTYKGNVLLLSKNGKKYIAKFKRRTRLTKGLLFLLADHFGLVKLSFVEELLFLRALDKINFNHFNYSRLIETDGKTYFIMEYIEGSEGEWRPDIDQKQTFAKTLCDFQISAGGIKGSWKMKLVSPLFGPEGSVIRLASTNGFIFCGPRAFLRIIYLTLKMVLRNPRQKTRFLIHGDLIPSPERPEGIIKTKNIIFGQNGKMYLIDFELTVGSRIFFLSDIVDIAFNFEEEKVDWDWMIIFMNEHKNKISWVNVKIKDQIRIALLRNVLNKMISKTYRAKYKQFLLNVLLCDKNFNHWMDVQMNNTKINHPLESVAER